MATTRQRRAGTTPPAYAIDEDGDRIYTEDDYAARENEPHPDEWEENRETYPSAGWTDPDYLPDEAFTPDEPDLIEAADWAEAREDESPFLSQEGYSPLFAQDVDFSDDPDPLSDELLTEEERAELRRNHWQLVAGLADFAGVVLGTGAILIIIALLVSLINWLVNDMSQSFILLQKNF